ncbi:hypothetical protein SAMN05216223_10556 [Actinacidiphila yanglinensis]|uniref:Dolichyl-phosphate-mannose-protein mannosyltransferase n=1 Tax=Actinacidiphila yanglinensis TaxID=310779 RepID=A0A1H5ZYL8_9ACTN|nr:hypothetical protein [Actinacidiphila yanglinensis]SEG41613.1 hypothetical protein SAMN05216223_10556 [Actinacidiphila yanglinensis]
MPEPLSQARPGPAQVRALAARNAGRAERAPAAQAPRRDLWVAAVCALFVAAQLLLVLPGARLGWDETVYTSQVSGRIPAAFFSAPRARGISFLAAPVAQFTDSPVALRLWMAALSGIGLYAALRMWRPLLPERVLALAAALFAGLWITLFYGPQVMPNLWSAYGALAAVGCFLRAGRNRADRAALVGLAAGVTVVGLMRPPDAAWLVAPLAVAALAVPRWRRPALFAVLAAGVVLGCAEWVIEAYVRYGGLAERLHRSSGVEGGMGLHMAVDDQVRSLNGRALCRPCTVSWRHKDASVWWFVLPFLAAGGAVAVPRVRRSAVWLAGLIALAMAVPYLFTISYAAPRFLLPTYALLALPVSECLWWLVTRSGARAGRPGERPGMPAVVRLRPAATALVAVLLLGHLAVQGSVLRTATRNNHRTGNEYQAVADGLHAHGVRAPCTLTGVSAVPISFYTGCSSRQLSGPDESITTAGLLAQTGHRPVAVLVTGGGRPPAFARDWRSVELPTPHGARHFRAYLAPDAPRSG